eukprot:3939142-Rhodomonas_salina.1
MVSCGVLQATEFAARDVEQLSSCFFNPGAHGNLLLPTRVINAAVREDAVHMASVIDTFCPRGNMHVVCARLVDVDGTYEPVHVLLKFTDVVPPRVKEAIEICVDAEDFLASTDELDSAVATLKEFGMCLVAGNDKVPQKTFISRNEKGAAHKWDICTDGAMLLQIHNNDTSRSHCTRVYISKQSCCEFSNVYEVHVVMKKVESIMRAGYVASNVVAMQEVCKLLATVQCSGPRSVAAPLLAADPVILTQYIAVSAIKKV